MGIQGKAVPIAWCDHVRAIPLIYRGGTAIQLQLSDNGELFEKVERGEVMILCRACFLGEPIASG